VEENNTNGKYYGNFKLKVGRESAQMTDNKEILVEIATHTPMDRNL
jgi:hypothetical protein